MESIKKIGLVINLSPGSSLAKGRTSMPSVPSMQDPIK